MNFFEQKKTSDYITFTDVFEFFSNLKIMIFLDILMSKMSGCMHLQSTWDRGEIEQKNEECESSSRQRFFGDFQNR